MNTPENIDDYIADFPDEVQKILQNIRKAIQKMTPDSTEAIKYAIPTFVLNGTNLVHFAAFKNHIGFYPTPTGIESFENALSVYKQGKGSVQFPLNQPIPMELIEKIVKFRIDEVSKKR